MPAPFDKGLDFMPFDTFAFETLTVAGTAVGFTAATFAEATLAMAKVEGAQIRYRTDGNDPSATVGVIADPGDVIAIVGYRDITSIRFIRTGATATLSTEFGR